MPSSVFLISKTEQYDGSFKVLALSFPDAINAGNPKNSVVRLSFPDMHDAKIFASAYQSKLNE